MVLLPRQARHAVLIAARVVGGGARRSPLCNDLQADYNGCLTGDGGYTTTMCDPTMLAASNGSATCTATVGDFTSCLNDPTAALNAIPSCSTLTAAKLASLSADGRASPPPASCTALNGVPTGSTN